MIIYKASSASLTKDLLTMPIKVLPSGDLSARREEYHLAERRLPVVLPSERVGLDGIGELLSEVDP